MHALLRPIAAEASTSTAVPGETAVPKQLVDGNVEPANQTKDKPAVQPGGASSLEELEEQSYKKLAGMKRPASKLETQKKAQKAPARPKTKENAKKPGAVGKILGCPRCRGTPNGCSLCQDPCYNGVRTPGKQAWRDYMAKRKKEKAQLKTKKK